MSWNALNILIVPKVWDGECLAIHAYFMHSQCSYYKFILDINMEKLQKQTLEYEKVRREQARLSRERAQARSRLGGAKIQCARVWREKKCCVDCLQVCCVGDCNEQKKYSDTLCFQCNEKHQDGACMQNVYELRFLLT